MVQLQKVHGSENSFFILDQTQLQQPLSDSQLIALAQYLTNSQNGILNGADGLLVISDSKHEQALAKMQVINSDGSIASMCGNGLRTVGRYLADKYQQDSFQVETANADLHVSRQLDWAADVHCMSVEISPVSFQKQALPFANLDTDTLINTPISQFAPDLKFTALAVPNPHLISFVDERTLKSSLLQDLGTRLNQANPYFPEGVNVSFAQILNPQQLFVRTYERGVGFTNACGTGMSATSLAFALAYPQYAAFNQLLTIYNPGGYVQTRVHQTSTSYWMELIGNATITHYLDIEEQFLLQTDDFANQVKITTTAEEAAYQNFVKQATAS